VGKIKPLFGEKCPSKTYMMAQFAGWEMENMPLRGQFCNLKHSRYPARLKFKDGPSVAIMKCFYINEVFVCINVHYGKQ
jgi:hypothetical protein